MSEKKFPKGPILNEQNKPIGEIGSHNGRVYLAVHIDEEFPDELTSELILTENTSPQRPVNSSKKGNYIQ